MLQLQVALEKVKKGRKRSKEQARAMHDNESK
jgi:hypothetical protein